MVTEWENAPLKTICIKIQDGTHFSPTVNGGKYLYVTSKNIGYGTFDISNAQRIDAYQHAKIYERCDVKYGDLLLTKDGANTGNATLNPLWEEFSLLSSVAFLRFDPNQHDARFYLQQILSYAGQQQIKDAMSGNAITRLTLEKIKNLSFIIAPLPEQTAIAEALSDADSLIASLEKLIAKKKAIKQGAMQELLTGKKRLPGFGGEWEEVRFGDLGEFYSGLSGKNKDDFGTGSAKYITFLNVLSNTIIDVKILESVDIGENEHQFSVRYGDLFFNTSSETPEEVGMCAVLLGNVSNTYLNSFCFGFRLKGNEHDPLFLSYYFNSKCGRKIMFVMAQGATRYNLSKSNFAETIIALPKKAEQIAIASILSDMDAEIEQLEKKLTKYRFIKQGMMQELLTGQIRLVDSAMQADASAEDKPISKGHNPKYDDAIAISAIVNAFYDDRFILGRVKVQKLLYLLRRKQDADVSAFKKKAVGPYNEKVRYNGGESIAIKEGYVVRQSGNAGSKFGKGMNIGVALQYVGSTQADIDWLLEKFRFFNTNENKENNNLEVLATVDMAVCELAKTGQTISVDAVKGVIHSNKEWEPKLKKPCFTDAAIQKAIEESEKLFG